jgi:hypothetical protein
MNLIITIVTSIITLSDVLHVFNNAPTIWIGVDVWIEDMSKYKFGDEVTLLVQ